MGKLIEEVKEWKKMGDVDGREIRFEFGDRDMEELDDIINKAIKSLRRKVEYNKELAVIRKEKLFEIIKEVIG